MATGFTLPAFPCFDPDIEQSNLSQRWSKWLSRFENFLLAADISSDPRKRALLLHYAGERVHDIFDTLSDTGDASDYAAARTSLITYFTPKKNTAFEILVFRRSSQNTSETLDQFHTRLQTLAAHCDFSNKADEIRNQIIQGCSSSRLRQRILELKPADNTLTNILDIGRRMEAANRDAREIEGEGEREKCHQITRSEQQFCEYKTTTPQYRKTRPFPKETRSSQSPAQICRNCGGPFPHSHGHSSCPAYGRTSQTPKVKCRNCGGTFPHPQGPATCPPYGRACFACSRRGHFAAFCQQCARQSYLNSSTAATKPSYRPSSPSTQFQTSRGARQVRSVNDTTPRTSFEDDSYDSHAAETSENSDNEYSYHITQETVNAINRVKPEICLSVNGIVTKFMIDTGSTIDTVAEREYTSSFQHYPLQHCTNAAFAYATNVALPIIGTFRAEITSRHASVNTILHIVKDASDSLLGYETSKSLQLVQITRAVTETSSNPVEQMKREYADRFKGLGKFMKSKVKLHINDTVMPVAQPHRRQPFHTREKVDKELDRLLHHDVIEPATGPTTWASPIVTPPKPTDPDAIRICVDMRVPNQAILRHRWPTQTIEQLIYRLNGATVFSKLDLNNG